MKREELEALSLTKEQIDAVMASYGKDIKSFKDQAEKDAAEITRLKEGAQEDETSKDEITKLTERIAEYEKRDAVRGARETAMDKFKVNSEQAKTIIKDDGSFDYEALGTVIAEKEAAAIKTAKEEIARNSEKPRGGSGGNSEGKDLTDGEKFAAAYAKAAAERDKAANEGIKNYL